jgi:hypothetical protein
MNQPSSTIQAAGGFAGLAVFVIIAIAIWAPEQYAVIKQFPGFEGALVGVIATIAGYLKRENVLK